MISNAVADHWRCRSAALESVSHLDLQVRPGSVNARPIQPVVLIGQVVADGRDAYRRRQAPPGAQPEHGESWLVGVQRSGRGGSEHAVLDRGEVLTGGLENTALHQTEVS